MNSTPINWRTTLYGIAGAIISALTVLAALPYQLGDVAEVIPPDWKPYVVTSGIIAGFALRALRGFVSADAAALKQVNERVDSIKRDLGELLDKADGLKR